MSCDVEVMFHVKMLIQPIKNIRQNQPVWSVLEVDEKATTELYWKMI